MNKQEKEVLKHYTNDLEYYCKNAEEDYIKTPISVLAYISKLESALNKRKNGMRTYVAVLLILSALFMFCLYKSFGTIEAAIIGGILLVILQLSVIRYKM